MSCVARAIDMLGHIPSAPGSVHSVSCLLLQVRSGWVGPRGSDACLVCVYGSRARERCRTGGARCRGLRVSWTLLASLCLCTNINAPDHIPSAPSGAGAGLVPARKAHGSRILVGIDMSTWQAPMDQATSLRGYTETPACFHPYRPASRPPRYIGPSSRGTHLVEASPCALLHRPIPPQATYSNKPPPRGKGMDCRTCVYHYSSGGVHRPLSSLNTRG